MHPAIPKKHRLVMGKRLATLSLGCLLLDWAGRDLDAQVELGRSYPPLAYYSALSTYQFAPGMFSGYWSCFVAIGLATAATEQAPWGIFPLC